MNFESLVKDLDTLPHSHDILRLLLEHPQLTANGWEIADKLVPFVKLQDPTAIEILMILGMQANAKEMIMSAVEVLSFLDHEEAVNQFLLLHYGQMYLNGT
jgi:hypothetical protein